MDTGYRFGGEIVLDRKRSQFRFASGCERSDQVDSAGDRGVERHSDLAALARNGYAGPNVIGDHQPRPQTARGDAAEL